MNLQHKITDLDIYRELEQKEPKGLWIRAEDVTEAVLKFRRITKDIEDKTVLDDFAYHNLVREFNKIFGGFEETNN